MSNMKNIVVVKNLPSNLVEEAIVILKSNKQAKKLEYIEKGTNINNNSDKKTKEYMIKEAESVISSYISKIESNQKGKKSKYEEKYKKLKLYSIVTTIIIVFSIIRCFL